METFSTLLAICAGNLLVTGEFPAHKGQWRGALMFSLICAWMNGLINNREAGDLRRHRTHYDFTAMVSNNDQILMEYTVPVLIQGDTCNEYYYKRIAESVFT